VPIALLQIFFRKPLIFIAVDASGMAIAFMTERQASLVVHAKWNFAICIPKRKFSPQGIAETMIRNHQF